MRYWRIILISVLAFAPIALFAVAPQYPNPLGCKIDTIPEFVKEIITIIVKVGIPIGTLFLRWAGFLFVTAQGNETKLSTAKNAFVWSCIGLGVLLGAWVFAVGVEGIIKDFGKGGGGSAIDSGCKGGGEPPPTDLTLPSVVEHVLFGEKSLHAGLGTIFVSGSSCSSSGNGFNPNDVMADYGLDPDDPRLFEKSLKILHDDAIQKAAEQAYLFVRFGSGGGALLHTASGNASSVEFPPVKTIEDVIITPSLSGVSSINLMHTHPTALFNGSIPPSLPDLQGAYVISNIEPATTYSSNVADLNGVWTFSVSPGSGVGKAVQGIIDNSAAIYASPEAKSYMDAHGLNACSDPGMVFSVLQDILNGSAGTAAQDLAKNLVTAALPLQPFVDMDAKLPGASNSEWAAIMAQRLELEQSMGVSLKYDSM